MGIGIIVGEEMAAGESRELRSLDVPNSANHLNSNGVETLRSRGSTSTSSMTPASSAGAEAPNAVQERKRLLSTSSSSPSSQQRTSFLRALFAQMRALFSFAPYRSLIAAFLSLTLGLQVCTRIRM